MLEGNRVYISISLRKFLNKNEICIGQQEVFVFLLKETLNAKSQLVLVEWAPCLCLRFVLYDMRLCNTFIIVMYGVMNYS